MDTIQGASGSPVLNTENEVVGVVSEGQVHWQGSIQTKQLMSLIQGKIDVDCREYDTKVCINKTLESNSEEAENGIIEAQYQLSKYLQDKEELVAWMQKAAKQDYAPAQFSISLMYYKGEGVEQNTDTAEDWMKKAGEQDYSPALNSLVEMYLFGKIVEQNMEEAIYWIRQAVDQGNVTSTYYLGVMYFSGSGVEQNEKEAFDWIQRVALQNHVPALELLSKMYYNGDGVEQNKIKAAEYLLRAAIQDYLPAEGDLLRFRYFDSEMHSIITELQVLLKNNSNPKMRQLRL